MIAFAMEQPTAIAAIAAASLVVVGLPLLATGGPSSCFKKRRHNDEALAREYRERARRAALERQAIANNTTEQHPQQESNKKQTKSLPRSLAERQPPFVTGNQPQPPPASRKKKEISDGVMAQAAHRAALERWALHETQKPDETQEKSADKAAPQSISNKGGLPQESNTKQQKPKKARKIKLPEPKRFAPKPAPTDLRALEKDAEQPNGETEETEGMQAATETQEVSFCPPVGRNDSVARASLEAPTTGINREQLLERMANAMASSSDRERYISEIRQAAASAPTLVKRLQLLALARKLESSGNGEPSSTEGEKTDDRNKALKEAMVVRDGLTSFFHIPDLASSEHATFLMNRLAKEFLPIIKRRGYQIFSVSELCCCSDGTKAALGQVRNKSRIKAVMAGGATEDQCGGYNRTIRLDDDGKTMHLICVRLRDRTNHYKFRSYEKEIAVTMAHELAHCVHQNHSPAFYQLMDEIKKEHADLVASGAVHQNMSVEEQYGFDIYGQSNVRSRF